MNHRRGGLRLVVALSVAALAWQCGLAQRWVLSMLVVSDVFHLGRWPADAPPGWQARTIRAPMHGYAPGWLRVRLASQRGAPGGRWYMAFRAHGVRRWEVYGALVSRWGLLAKAHIGGDLTIVPVDTRGVYFETWAGGDVEFAVFSPESFTLTVPTSAGPEVTFVRFER